MNLTLKQLHYITQLTRHLNISTAACELGITQPALSIALQKIEKSLGFELFNRTDGHITLSKAGRMLAPKITCLISSYGRIVDAALDITSEKQAAAPVSTSIPASPWTYALKAILSKNPRFSVCEPASDSKPNIRLVTEYASHETPPGFKKTELLHIQGLCLAVSSLATRQGGTQSSGAVPSSTLFTPSESITPGLQALLQRGMLEDAGLYNPTVQQLTCFDQIAACCLNPSAVAIFPGDASVWKNIYGTHLTVTDLKPFQDATMTVSLISTEETDAQLVAEVAAHARDTIASANFLRQDQPGLIRKH